MGMTEDFHSYQDPRLQPPEDPEPLVDDNDEPYACEEGDCLEDAVGRYGDLCGCVDHLKDWRDYDRAEVAFESRTS